MLQEKEMQSPVLESKIDVLQIMREKWLYALKLTYGNEQDAKDLMQEAWLKTNKFITRAEKDYEVKAYFKSALKFCLIEKYRKESGTRGINGNKRCILHGIDWEILSEGGSLTDPSTEESLIHGENEARVLELIDLLPQKQKEVIVLWYFKKLPFKDIASMMKININTALGCHRYGLINLQKMMTYSLKRKPRQSNKN